MLGKFGRLVALPFSLAAIGLLTTPVYADDATVRIPHGCQGGPVSVTAGGPLTIVSGWTMSTRGNTQAFANAATGVMTINGQSVTPAKSEVFRIPIDSKPDGNADDPWRVQWSFTTTAPPLHGSMLITFDIVLSRVVADHETGSGAPSFLPAGPLFPQPFTCTVIGA